MAQRVTNSMSRLESGSPSIVCRSQEFREFCLEFCERCCLCKMVLVKEEEKESETQNEIEGILFLNSQVHRSKAMIESIKRHISPDYHSRCGKGAI